MTDKSLFTEIQPAPERLYVVGDIHGCPDELLVLLEHLKTKEKISEKDAVVFIGDYIDRGPNSFGAVEVLIEFQKAYANAKFLKGNHEDSFLDYCELGGDAGPVYFFNGGVQFFQSYGLSSVDPHHSIMAQLPETHQKFYKELLTGITVPGYLIVHAGIRPEVPLEEQTLQDLLWIRDEFLEYEGALPATVVFGHTPLPEVLFEPGGRIGIDTGLVYGNRLSCIELKSSNLIQVRRGMRKVLCTNLKE
jgi:serine/threonine protein phosphatase 1